MIEVMVALPEVPRNAEGAQSEGRAYVGGHEGAARDSIRPEPRTAGVVGTPTL